MLLGFFLVSVVIFKCKMHKNNKWRWILCFVLSSFFRDFVRSFFSLRWFLLISAYKNIISFMYGALRFGCRCTMHITNTNVEINSRIFHCSPFSLILSFHNCFSSSFVVLFFNNIITIGSFIVLFWLLFLLASIFFCLALFERKIVLEWYILLHSIRYSVNTSEYLHQPAETETHEKRTKIRVRNRNKKGDHKSRCTRYKKENEIILKWKEKMKIFNIKLLNEFSLNEYKII